MGKQSVTLSIKLAKTQCYEFECFKDNYSLTISLQGCRINNWPIFFRSLATDPEVFEKVNSSQFPSSVCKVANRLDHDGDGHENVA